MVSVFSMAMFAVAQSGDGQVSWRVFVDGIAGFESFTPVGGYSVSAGIQSMNSRNTI
ncbi:MAG: hypothetical protein U0K19_02085 [Bifidobacteriaceae bacterium]|nr:hypothetical protein [Bifidobacteriaceae bacterium]